MLLYDVPGQTQVGHALDNLAGQGILGSLCILLMVALFLTLKALLKAKDDRHGDQKVMAETLQKLNEAFNVLVMEVNKSSANLVLEASRSQDAMKAALQTQEKAMDTFADSIKELTGEITDLRVAIGRLSKGSLHP
jgi:hypothetical protein